MADEPTTSDFETAIEHAHAEIDALRASAADADATSDIVHEDGSLHEVEGMGRYVVPYYSGWEPLLKTIRDPRTHIQFSSANYPTFDRRIAETLAEKASIASLPLPLRDNIAAVRNFLMQTYYADTPEGMTAESAAQALQEIAALLSDGLHGPVTPFDDQKKAFIDMHLASQVGGVGAQYIYEKILEIHRQSGWLRPFNAIVALFGGKTTADWMLPAADQTPFYTMYDTELAPDAMSTMEEIDAAIQQLDDMETKRRALEEEMAIAATATDLDAMGNHLIYTAEHLKDVRQMSEPVRQDAIEIAKDILRKLKVSIGELNVLEGLGLKPRDELAPIGGIKAVALVYERLLAWGRGIDASIMQHPSILAATQAIGQLGYIAKLESMRIAQKAANPAQAQMMQQQMKLVPSAYTKPTDKQMAGLLDKVERGIDTVLNRIVTITGPGAMVGHSRSNELGNYMSGTPIAGTAMQVNAEGVGSREAKQQNAIQEGLAAANRAQIQRVTQQMASQQSRNNTAQQPAQGAQARGSASAQLAAMRQRLNQTRRNVTHQLAQRANIGVQARNALRPEDHDPQHPQSTQVQPPNPMAATMAKIDPRLMNNLKQMNTTTMGLTTNPVLTGRAAFDKIRQANTYGIKGTVPAAKPMTDEEKKKQQALNPPPPKKDGRGI